MRHNFLLTQVESAYITFTTYKLTEPHFDINAFYFVLGHNTHTPSHFQLETLVELHESACYSTFFFFFCFLLTPKQCHFSMKFVKQLCSSFIFSNDHSHQLVLLSVVFIHLHRNVIKFLLDLLFTKHVREKQWNHLCLCETFSGINKGLWLCLICSIVHKLH